jgi:hypothetical protein
VQAVDRRLRDHEPVCVRLHITESCADAAFSTPTCAGGGGGRVPNDCERRLFDLRSSHHLNSRDFKGGDVVSFLHDAERLVA